MTFYKKSGFLTLPMAEKKGLLQLHVSMCVHVYVWERPFFTVDF